MATTSRAGDDLADIDDGDGGATTHRGRAATATPQATPQAKPNAPSSSSTSSPVAPDVGLLRVRVLEAEGLPRRHDGSVRVPFAAISVNELSRRRTRRTKATAAGPAGARVTRGGRGGVRRA